MRYSSSTDLATKTPVAGAYAAEHPAQGIGHPAVQQQGQDQQDDAHGQKSLEQALFLCAVHTESLLQY